MRDADLDDEPYLGSLKSEQAEQERDESPQSDYCPPREVIRERGEKRRKREADEAARAAEAAARTVTLRRGDCFQLRHAGEWLALTLANLSTQCVMLRWTHYSGGREIRGGYSFPVRGAGAFAVGAVEGIAVVSLDGNGAATVQLTTNAEIVR